MTEQLSAVAAFLRRHDNYDILTHDYHDGDTLGSAFALCLVLQQMGKDARVITTYLPDDFLFLQKDVEKQDFVAQTVVSVDVADTKLLGSNRAVYEGKIDLCIDHHMTNKVMVPLRLVDGGAAANCEILYKLFQHMEISWTRAIANCLYTGILERWPESTVVIMTPLHREWEDLDTPHLQPFVDAIREVAEFYSLPVLDLWATSGLQPRVPIIKEKYFADHVHPADAGHQVIANKLKRFLENM